MGQKSIKNEYKKIINFLIDFWIDFFMNFEGFGKQKSSENTGGVIVFENFWFLLEHQFLIKF